MNIQKMVIDDQNNALATHGGGMMAVPDVGVPRANPLTMIWRRRGVLVVVLGVCVLAALIKYAVSPAIYRSEARLFVQTNSLKSGSDTGPTTASELQRQCERIRTAPVLNDVRASLADANLKTFDATSRWNTLRENLNVNVAKDNELILVSFDSPYKVEAQLILKSVVDAFSNFYTKEKKAHLFELEKARKDKVAEVESRRKELLEFRKKNGALTFNGEKGNLETQKLNSLQDALTQEHLEAVNAKSAAEVMRGKMSDPVELARLADYLRATGTVVSTDPNDQTLRKQLFDMEQQLDGLRARLMKSHPAVSAAEATVVALRARVAEMDAALAARYIMTLDQNLARARAREADLQQSYEEQKKVALALSAKSVEMDQMEADVKSVTGQLEKIEGRLLELKASENVGVPTIQVFDEPSLPSMPIKPVLTMMLFQGLMIGLILGCLAALIRDWTDQGLRNAEEVTQAVGVPLLGSVPHISGPVNPMATGRKVDLEPASDVAETYRTIRTAVFFGTPDRESRTILVTSPAPGDGKSTFASNLAIAMAQTGKRVLLVDCDFRRPVQHRVFECRPGDGLSTVLTGKASLDHTIQNTGISGLDILPAGPIPTNPSEILNSQSFSEVLEELSVRYEHVVVDSPPVMAVADSRILAAMCSVCILVVRAESTTRKAAVHSRRALESVGAHILGVVVNDVPRGRDNDGAYGGYSSYRAKYNNGHTNGYTAPVEPVVPRDPKTTAIIPAKSFLDLRRK